jgi:6-pyruvoyltetrahydropterin/6-carboxytetrahydropterin synthase
MQVRLTKDFSFEAAHTLPNVPPGHKCARMHGHSFRVEISVEGEVDPKMGWLYDHAQIGEATMEIVDMLDHNYLNDIKGLENPTFENLSKWIWDKLAPSVPGLCEVVIHETASVRCTYRGR